MTTCIVEDYPNYEVSNFGRVRHRELKIIKSLRFDRYGYYRVNLQKGSEKVMRYPHRLVAIAFLGRSDGKPTVNHVNNLEWCSRQENFNHGKETGLIKCKLDQKAAGEIRRLLSLGMLQKDIAKEYGVSKTTIWKISHNKIWKGY